MQARLLCGRRKLTSTSGTLDGTIFLTDIMATHRQLAAADERGELHVDLYYSSAQATLPILLNQVQLAH